MKKLLLSFILLCNCVIALEITGTVIKIIDGDTITILDNNNIQHKIRLRDIDAPEKKQPFYNKSKENKKGLWIDNNPIPPWDFRKQKK